MQASRRPVTGACSLAWLRKANFRALYQVVGCLWDSGSKACEKRLQLLTMMREELADARGLWLFPLFWSSFTCP